MSLLLTGLWPALAAALLLGSLVGALTGLPRERLALAAAATLAVVLVVSGGLAFSGRVPGEAGLWVEIGSLLLGAYLAGCLVGGTGRALAGSA